MDKKKEKTIDLSQAKDITQTSFVSVKPQHLQEKNYMVSVRSVLDSYCSFKDDKRIITQKDLKSLMRKMFKLQSRKIDKVLETYVRLGILEEYGDEQYIIKLIKPFVTLNPETVQYCLTTLSELSFKVYCYLKMRYEIHQKSNIAAPWAFSVTGVGGLLDICGYSPDGGSNNRKRMNWVLETLQSVGLIQVSNPFPVKDIDGRFHGWYRYLIKVNDKSSPQTKMDYDDLIV